MGLFPKPPKPVPPANPAMQPTGSGVVGEIQNAYTAPQSLISTSPSGLRRRANTMRTSLIGGG